MLAERVTLYQNKLAAISFEIDGANEIPAELGALLPVIKELTTITTKRCVRLSVIAATHLPKVYSYLQIPRSAGVDESLSLKDWFAPENQHKWDAITRIVFTPIYKLLQRAVERIYASFYILIDNVMLKWRSERNNEAVMSFYFMWTDLAAMNDADSATIKQFVKHIGESFITIADLSSNRKRFATSLINTFPESPRLFYDYFYPSITALYHYFNDEWMRLIHEVTMAGNAVPFAAASPSFKEAKVSNLFEEVRSSAEFVQSRLIGINSADLVFKDYATIGKLLSATNDNPEQDFALLDELVVKRTGMSLKGLLESSAFIGCSNMIELSRQFFLQSETKVSDEDRVVIIEAGNDNNAVVVDDGEVRVDDSLWEQQLAIDREVIDSMDKEQIRGRLNTVTLQFRAILQQYAIYTSNLTNTISESAQNIKDSIPDSSVPLGDLELRVAILSTTLNESKKDQLHFPEWAIRLNALRTALVDRGKYITRSKIFITLILLVILNGFFFMWLNWSPITNFVSGLLPDVSFTATKVVEPIEAITQAGTAYNSSLNAIAEAGSVQVPTISLTWSSAPWHYYNYMVDYYNYMRIDTALAAATAAELEAQAYSNMGIFSKAIHNLFSGGAAVVSTVTSVGSAVTTIPPWTDHFFVENWKSPIKFPYMATYLMEDAAMLSMEYCASQFLHIATSRMINKAWGEEDENSSVWTDIYMKIMSNYHYALYGFGTMCVMPVARELYRGLLVASAAAVFSSTPALVSFTGLGSLSVAWYTLSNRFLNAIRSNSDVVTAQMIQDATQVSIDLERLSKNVFIDLEKNEAALRLLGGKIDATEQQKQQRRLNVTRDVAVQLNLPPAEVKRVLGLVAGSPNAPTYALAIAESKSTDDDTSVADAEATEQLQIELSIKRAKMFRAEQERKRLAALEEEEEDE